jgi:hypothetical protein
MSEEVNNTELLLTYADLSVRWGRTIGALRIAHHRGNLPEPDYQVGIHPIWTEKTIREAEHIRPTLSKRSKRKAARAKGESE